MPSWRCRSTIGARPVIKRVANNPFVAAGLTFHLCAGSKAAKHVIQADKGPVFCFESLKGPDKAWLPSKHCAQSFVLKLCYTQCLDGAENNRLVPDRSVWPLASLKSISNFAALARSN